MNSWRDMVKDLETSHAVSVDSVFSPDFGPKDTKDTKDTGTFSQSGEVSKLHGDGNIGGVLDNILQGVQSLQAMRCPNLQDKSVWPVIVSDAITLAKPDPVAGYSMADRAMSLGWDAKDLFGFWPNWQSQDDWVSLSVWAQSRRVLVIGERTACLSTTEKSDAHYDRLNGRPPLNDIKYFWELS